MLGRSRAYDYRVALLKTEEISRLFQGSSNILISAPSLKHLLLKQGGFSSNTMLIAAIDDEPANFELIESFQCISCLVQASKRAKPVNVKSQLLDYLRRSPLPQAAPIPTTGKTKFLGTLSGE